MAASGVLPEPRKSAGVCGAPNFDKGTPLGPGNPKGLRTEVRVRRTLCPQFCSPLSRQRGGPENLRACLWLKVSQTATSQPTQGVIEANKALP